MRRDEQPFPLTHCHFSIVSSLPRAVLRLRSWSCIRSCKWVGRPSHRRSRLGRESGGLRSRPLPAGPCQQRGFPQTSLGPGCIGLGKRGCAPPHQPLHTYTHTHTLNLGWKGQQCRALTAEKGKGGHPVWESPQPGACVRAADHVQVLGGPHLSLERKEIPWQAQRAAAAGRRRLAAVSSPPHGPGSSAGQAQLPGRPVSMGRVLGQPGAPSRPRSTFLVGVELLTAG